MALTPLQRDVSHLLAESRRASGESYVAGGAALNELLSAPRLSRDLDLFHDTERALAATWAADRRWLEAGGYALRVLRERPTFVEAEVQRGGETVAGRAVLLREGALYAGGVSSLESDIAASRLLFHPGRIRGAFPTLRG